MPEGLVPAAHGPRRRYVGKNATALAIAALAVGCSSSETVGTPAADSGSSSDVAADTQTADTQTADTQTADTQTADTSVADSFGSDVADDGGAVPLYK